MPEIKEPIIINGTATKALEILREELNNDNATIAYVMNDLIQRIPNTLADFKDLYKKHYAIHHNRKMEERIKKNNTEIHINTYYFFFIS